MFFGAVRGHFQLDGEKLVLPLQLVEPHARS